jgi:hypothetical protein
MEEKLISILRYIKKYNQISKNRKITFEDLEKSFQKSEAQNGYHQLKNLGYIITSGLIITISEEGLNKLREIDEANELRRRLDTNELDLIHKQKVLLDTQLKDYPLFKKISVAALIISILGFLGLIVDILIKLFYNGKV